MDQVIIPLDERLANPGDTLPVEGRLTNDSYTMGGREFRLPEGLVYDVVLTNAGEGILATGLLKGHVVGTCDRCLDPAEFDIAGEVDEYFLFKAPEDEQGLEDDEEEGPDYSLVGADDTIDLTEALVTALFDETPYVVLCKPDCKGLCPVCGANLNHEDCGHAKQIEEERQARSPFAVLKDLDLGDNT